MGKIVFVIAGCILLLTLTGCTRVKTHEQINTDEEKDKPIAIETVKTETFTMDYFKFGTGKRIFVILPGLTAKSVMYSADAIAQRYELLKDDFTIYVFDQPHNLPSFYPPSAMAEDVIKACETLGLKQINLFGVSMGGMIALEIANHNPELIETLMLVSTSVDVNEEEFQAIQKWIDLVKNDQVSEMFLTFGEAVYPKEIFEASRDLLLTASKDVTKEESERFILLGESLKDYDGRDVITKIECPLFIIGDKQDCVFGPSAMKTMEELLSNKPNVTFYYYDGYGHALYDTAPDFTERILDFLKQN